MNSHLTELFRLLDKLGVDQLFANRFFKKKLQDTITANSGSGGSGGVTVGGVYDNDADALAALGAGQLYKSSTSINGSPIILITSGSSSYPGPYATNTEAVAAIGTGKLYKSSIMLNGSSQILITV